MGRTRHKRTLIFMKALIRKIRVSLLIFFIVVLVVSLLAVYWPIYHELRVSLESTFAANARSRAATFNQFVNNSLDSARAMSSRSMIRDAILDYLEGGISFEELADYTKEPYYEGLSAYQDVGYAARIVNGLILVEQGTLKPGSDYLTRMPAQLAWSIEREQDAWFLVVHSPIVLNGRILGYDIMTYALCDLLQHISSEQINATITTWLTLDEMTASQHAVRQAEDGLFFDLDHLVYYAFPVDNQSHALLFQAEKETVYQTLYRMILINIGTMFGLFLFIYLFINFMLSHHAQNLFRYMEKTIQTQQEALYQASCDELTGAYTRRYGLEALKRSLRQANLQHQRLSICFVDVNGLKQVNDTLGHEAGDALLKTAADGMMRHIRKSDYLVRFGGDEFVIVLHEASRYDAEKAWQRTLSYFKKINDRENRPYLVSVSHGIIELTQADESKIDQLISLADEAMYEEKRKIKASLQVLR